MNDLPELEECLVSEFLLLIRAIHQSILDQVLIYIDLLLES